VKIGNPVTILAAYIKLIFEYACEIWDNCGVCYSTKLEQLHLDAARIVTGLPIFTKTDKLLYSWRNKFSKIIWCMSILYIIK
jgi:hypothetical protein